MFGHLHSRMSTAQHTLAVALFYSVSLMALPMTGYAVTFGQTIITSAQHEPLKASIAITDFKPSNFSIALANSKVYQQLGLTSPASLSASFIPTSATSGHVIIRTSQPITAPFADLVLSINEQGQRTMVPKTLLLPLSSHAVLTPLNTNALNNNPLNDELDKNPTLAQAINSQPLTVMYVEPPPLLTTPNTQMPLQVKVLTSESSLPALKAYSSPIAQEINAINNVNLDNSTSLIGFNTQNKSVSMTVPTTLIAKKTLDTLNIQVIRRIQSANQAVLTENNSDLPEILVDVINEASKHYALEARVM